MALYAGAMALVGLLAVAALAGEQVGARGVKSDNPGFALMGLFGIGFFLNGFIANFLITRRPRR
jgi:hypothetical protein